MYIKMTSSYLQVTFFSIFVTLRLHDLTGDLILLAGDILQCQQVGGLAMGRLVCTSVASEAGNLTRLCIARFPNHFLSKVVVGEPGSRGIAWDFVKWK